ncbi:MAG TPA: TIGR02444 family protein [Xanthobacteraceae bacterium]|nr:TIGR02444 family protein [Xanthobacteraceae bacterium]
MSQAAPKAPPQGSPFWHFSLGLYRAPGVADACILLQDEAGVDVNLLFFLLWNASLKRQFASTDVHSVDSRVAGWRKTAVVPLREIRRALKSAAGLSEPGAAELFRTKVKELELEAERLQQETLFALSQSAALGKEAASAAEAARVNLQAYEKYLAKNFPKEPVDKILAAFGAKHG